MKKFYGTFGLGHKEQGFIQPIIATDESEAHKLMFEKYGPKFAFIYDEGEFAKELEDGFHVGKKYFEPLKQGVI